VELTVAVLVSVPGDAGVVTAMVTTMVEPFVTAPNVQVTVVVPEHDPCVVDEDAKVVPAGMVSTSLPSTVSINPKFLIVMVYVSVEEMNTGVGDAVEVTAKSACVALSTKTEVVEALLKEIGSEVLAVTSAEFKMTVPAAVAPATATTIVKDPVPPFARATPSVQIICPVPPTAGTVPQVQPAGGVTD
jgi:hypothetical protein